jgi:hypothetical protein
MTLLVQAVLFQWEFMVVFRVLLQLLPKLVRQFIQLRSLSAKRHQWDHGEALETPLPSYKCVLGYLGG